MGLSFSRKADFMRWLPVAFITNVAFIVKHGRFERTALPSESACSITSVLHKGAIVIYRQPANHTIRVVKASSSI